VFDNAGQDCCARSRILVQRSVLDEFLALLEPAVLGVRVEDPSLDTSEMGPLISAGHRDTVSSFISEATNVVIRGEVPDGPGYWYPTTVVVPEREDDPLMLDEVFGPVVAVMPFDDEADAIRLSNATDYGLSGSIWTRDVGRAFRVARATESGNLSVNSHSSVRYWTPFGGFKKSGLGRELGPDALHHFTEVKNVFIATED
jgi:acyl-CoA reductase-like NAD-dependent aldehyde dehydrogenase